MPSVGPNRTCRSHRFLSYSFAHSSTMRLTLSCDSVALVAIGPPPRDRVAKVSEDVVPQVRHPHWLPLAKAYGATVLCTLSFSSGGPDYQGSCTPFPDGGELTTSQAGSPFSSAASIAFDTLNRKCAERESAMGRLIYHGWIYCADRRLMSSSVSRSASAGSRLRRSLTLWSSMKCMISMFLFPSRPMRS